MSEYFKNRVALITGAGSGIGKEVAIQFQKLGCVLVLIDKDLQSIRANTLIRSDNLLFEIDLSLRESIFDVFQQIKKKIGKIDFAFNAAGIGGVFSTIENYPIDNWYNVIEINLNAVFLCMKYEIPLLKNAGGGVIVNCASVLSKVGYANDSAYTASKHAVIGLTKSVALEYANSNIRVNAVSPGFTDTEMTKNYSNEKKTRIESKHAMNRFATTEEIANAVIWLCSSQSSFVCGHNLVVDGGFTIGSS